MFYIVVSLCFFRHNHTPFSIKNSYHSIIEENKIYVNINIFIILFNKKYLTNSNCGCTIFINRKLLLCSVTSSRIAMRRRRYMGARKQTIKIISFVCCAAIVAGIVTAKVREFSDNSTESVQEQAQKEENLEGAKNTTDKKTPDGKQGVKDVHKKDIQIKVNTLQLNEENEDCGIFFTLQSVTYKKAKYVLTCKIKNSRKGETVDVEKFAKGFSVKLGEAEWNAVLLTGRKTLKYHETTEAKMLVKCEQDVSGDMTNYRLFYTTEPEEDEDQIQQFRTEYIVKK